MSEVYGRKWPILLPFLICAIFSFISGAASNISTLLATRFLTGFFGAAPISCAGGAFVDMWNASERGNIFVVYTICVSGIPVRAIKKGYMAASISLTAIPSGACTGRRGCHCVFQGQLEMG